MSTRQPMATSSMLNKSDVQDTRAIAKLMPSGGCENKPSNCELEPCCMREKSDSRQTVAEKPKCTDCALRRHLDTSIDCHALKDIHHTATWLLGCSRKAKSH